MHGIGSEFLRYSSTVDTIKNEIHGSRRKNQNNGDKSTTATEKDLAKSTINFFNTTSKEYKRLSLSHNPLKTFKPSDSCSLQESYNQISNPPVRQFLLLGLWIACV